MLEEVISLSESFGAAGSAERFQKMDETYWAALRVCIRAHVYMHGQR